MQANQITSLQGWVEEIPRCKHCGGEGEAVSCRQAQGEPVRFIEVYKRIQCTQCTFKTKGGPIRRIENEMDAWVIGVPEIVANVGEKRPMTKDEYYAAFEWAVKPHKHGKS